MRRRARPAIRLDASTRGLMECASAADFSAVRVHTGAAAAQAAASIRARAYAFGNDVVFAQARYAPHTRAGQALLAHELAHVVQQSGRERCCCAPPAGCVIRCTRGGRSRPRCACGRARRERAAAASAFGRIGRRVQRYRPSRDRRSLTGGRRFSTSASAKRSNKATCSATTARSARPATRYCCAAPTSSAATTLPSTSTISPGMSPSGRWRSRGSGRPFKQTDPNRARSHAARLHRQRTCAAGQYRRYPRRPCCIWATRCTRWRISSRTPISSNSAKATNVSARPCSPASVGGTGSASIAHIEESIASPEMKPYYRRQAEAAEAAAPPLSHAKIAKDQPGSANYAPARRLAALVVQALGGQGARRAEVERQGRARGA